MIAASAAYVGTRLEEFPSTPTQPRLVFPSYVQANARIGARYESWTGSLFVDNMFNKRGIVGGRPVGRGVLLLRSLHSTTHGRSKRYSAFLMICFSSEGAFRRVLVRGRDRLFAHPRLFITHLNPFVAALTLFFTMTYWCGAVAAGLDPGLLAGMKWRQIGPFRGGRVVAVTGVPGDPTTWYFGAVAGGVWKSTNVGATWKPMFDEQKISSVGAIAVADSDHNVLYVGTGEACPRGDISYGDGVYKSVDGGRTWKNLGLRDTRHIGAVIVHPKDPDIVLVAALGHAFGPTTNAACSEPLTAGAVGPGCCTRIGTRAPLMSLLIRITPTSSMPRCGRCVDSLGIFPAVEWAPASISPQTPVSRGSS